ncbi:MAG: glycosyltransferase [Saprospiraceae bacterium]
MEKPIVVLQLFDTYLPSTLNWVDQLLEAGSDDIWVGAPWITDGAHIRAERRLFIHPLQKWFCNRLPNEFEKKHIYLFLSRLERIFGIYGIYLYKQVKRQKPDVLHAHFGTVGCLYVSLSRRLNRPLVVSFYGFDYAKVLHLNPTFREQYKRLFEQAAAVISCSRGEGIRQLEALGCPAHKIFHVTPAINITQFPFRVKYKTVNALHLVQVATLTPKKGHKTTLEALALAVQRYPEIQLTIAGESPYPHYRTELTQLAKTLGVEKHVTWHSFLPHASITNFLSQFDVFIHPSCHTEDGDHEATPVVILEAQALGLPVLSTRHWDIPYEVLDGQTGFLVAENDAQSLSRHIETFYRMDNEAYQAFAQRARQHVFDHFNIRQSAQALHAIYARLLST